jgi:hypothetical protein
VLRILVLLAQKKLTFISMKGFNHKKAVQALTFLASMEGGTINKMKAIKLIWLSDRLHLRKFGRTITGDTYFAMKLGPVASNTKDIIEGSSYCSEEELTYSAGFLNRIDNLHYAANTAPFLKVFSKSDTEALEKVYAVYGHLNQFELSELSHLFPEWKKWESQLAKSRTRVPMDFDDFFQNTDMDNPLFKDEQDTLDLVKSLFNRK